MRRLTVALVVWTLIALSCGGSAEPSTTTTTPPSEATPTTTSGGSAGTGAPPTTGEAATTLPPLTAPGDLNLLVVNATRRDAVAGLTADRLRQSGYSRIELDSMKFQQDTVIFHTEGLRREAAALAELIETATTQAVASVDQADMRVVLGVSYEQTLPPAPPPLGGQLAAWAGGGDPTACELDRLVDDPPDVYFGLGWLATTATRGAMVEICALGFVDDIPITAEIQTPSGRVINVTYEGAAYPLNDIRATGLLGFDWWIGPDYDLGTYRITATQRGLRTGWEFELIEPSRAFIQRVDGSKPSVHVVGGLEPGQARFGIYRDTEVYAPPNQVGGCDICTVFELVEELRLVNVDATGVVVLTVPSDLPPGIYCISSPHFEESVGTQDECADAVGGGWFSV